MRVSLLGAVVAALLITAASARAVNISNAWMLPEEGFPVFYRYFRDRISWNEADAVCQFHHANLVTVDTTSQYDAIRAYLKELDIANNVWIGLSRAEDKPNFTWRDFRDLSAGDYWEEAIPDGAGAPLCAAMDPAADFRWHALTCAGPEVASFICELPVPSWASGLDGCLITELPSLTVLYMPEQAAVELTSDCGLGGTKRIVCKGKSDRDELTRRLACTDDSIPLTSTAEARTPSSTTVAQTTSPSSAAARQATTRTSKPLIWTSNTIDTGEYLATRHRRGTEETSTPPATGSTTEISATLSTSAGSSVGTASQRPGSSMETEATSVVDGVQEEFASAINQGQLFSIIENGTLFDIIELNSTEENKTLAPDVTTPRTVVTTSSHTKHSTTTGVVYHVESTTQQAAPKQLSKEAVPDFPIVPSNENDLHRTFRKQVPKSHKPDTYVDIDVTNDIHDNADETPRKAHEAKTNRKQNKTIAGMKVRVASAILDITRIAEATIGRQNTAEAKARALKEKSDRLVKVKLQDGASNATKASFFVTTAIDDRNRPGKLSLTASPSRTPAPTTSVIMKQPITSRLPVTVLNIPLTHQQSQQVEFPVATEDTSYESEPTGKPNRQRQLTRSNRRSFYPYFFSRVLG